MTIIHNGNKIDINAPCTVAEYRSKIGKTKIPLMVKLNGTFIPEKDHEQVTLQDGDVLTMVLFLGGG